MQYVVSKDPPKVSSAEMAFPFDFHNSLSTLKVGFMVNRQWAVNAVRRVPMAI